MLRVWLQCGVLIVNHFRMTTLTMDEAPRIEKVPPSCANCRKKKAKCDRGQPCNACVKSKLRCAYERVSRTPLTRRYLTEVELELARTKALLSQYETSRSASNDTGKGTPSSPSTQQSADALATPFAPTTTIGCPAGTTVPSYTGASAGINTSPAFSLETPPAGDLDWDERASGTNVTRFNDGMASLIDRNGSYMGVASGAALLRMADDEAGENDEERQFMPLPSARTTPPILPALYSLAQLEPFIEAYFATYHISYPILHEPTFRAQFMDIIPRPNGQSWQVLLYIIAAIGCFAASEVPPEADVGLFEAAKQRMNIDMLETGNLTLVQALTLISNYIQKRNRPNSGYVYMALAKRMAWGLALHKEYPAWKDQPFRLELRRRIWWCLYIFDVGAIITFSRPLDMPAYGIEIGLPLNISDSDLTSSTTRSPAESQSTTLYTHVRCQSSFHLATNDIYQKLISVLPTAQEMLHLDQAHLQKWLSELPGYFAEAQPQPSRYRLCHAVLHWRWRNFRILMLRPYLMRRFMRRRHDGPEASSLGDIDHAEETAFVLCLDTARETIESIANFWRSERQNVLTCWYALYFLFQAVLIPVISLRNDSRSKSAPTWRDQILVALESMSDMSRLNPAAARCYAAVTKLCGAYLAMDINQWESPTNESPQTQMNTLYSYMFGPISDNQLFDMQDLQMQQEPSFMDFMGQLGAP